MKTIFKKVIDEGKNKLKRLLYYKKLKAPQN